jgi:hypothetical protein
LCIFELLYEELPWNIAKTNDDIIDMLFKGTPLVPSKPCGQQWKDVERLMKKCMGKVEERGTFEQIERKLESISSSMFPSSLMKVQHIGRVVEKKPEGFTFDWFSKLFVKSPASDRPPSLTIKPDKSPEKSPEKTSFLDKTERRKSADIPTSPLGEKDDVWTYQKAIESFKVLDNLKPHLQKLFDNDPTVIKLYLREMSIGVNGAKAVAKGLEVNTCLTSIQFNKVKIGVKGAISIAKALEVNKTLLAFFIYDDPIGDEGIKAICQALHGNKSLTTLVLNENKIGDEGSIAIAQLLEVNKTLMTLDLSGNDIGLEGLQLITNALKHNNTLKTLGLASIEYF